MCIHAFNNTFLFFLCLAFSILTGCSAEKFVTIETQADMRVSIVDQQSLGAAGELVEGTPAKISVEKLRNRIVKIEAKGFAPQFWYFDGWDGERTVLKPVLSPLAGAGANNSGQEAPSQGANSNQPSADNTSHRLLMKAYFALVSNEYEEARKTAESLERISPRLAAPHIIKGLAYYREGQLAAAKSSLQTAKSLDPQDTEIDQMLGLIP